MKMIKFTNIIIVLFLTFSLYGQKVSFGLEFSPNIFHPIIEKNTIVEVSKTLSFGFGVVVYLDISPKLQLLGGLHVSLQNFEYRDYSPIFTKDVSSEESQASYWSKDQEQFFVKTPILNRIKIIGEYNHLFMKWGFSGWWRLNRLQDYYLIESRIRSTKYETKKESIVDLYGVVSLGYEFIITKRIKGYVDGITELSVKKKEMIPQLFAVHKERRFISYGINFGIRF